MLTKIITKYDYDNHVHPGIDFNPKTNPLDRSLTNQSDKDASDINLIMAKYEKTGVLVDPLGIERKPSYGDFTEIKTYHETLSALRNVDRAFGLLPAKLRNRFENDPQKLIVFLDDPNNNDEAIELGLIPRPEAEETPAPAPPAPVPPPAVLS